MDRYWGGKRDGGRNIVIGRVHREGSGFLRFIVRSQVQDYLNCLKFRRQASTHCGGAKKCFCPNTEYKGVGGWDNGIEYPN